ncbi:MAG: heavy metal translocating P-type ATPase, partial [Clostridiales bacterium]|nr:heavy metal translocating P-type ATPase [Clostridiales bacterium]
MNSNQRRLARAIIGGAIFAFGALYRTDRPAVPLIVFLAALALAGGDVLWKAARNIARGRVFDENFLMSIATVGAFAIGDYAEGAAVMLFYQVGEVFQHYAVDRSRRSIAQLMDIRPDYANVRRDGAVERVDPDEVAVGEVIVIRPGEKVPLDA